MNTSTITHQGELHTNSSVNITLLTSVIVTLLYLVWLLWQPFHTNLGVIDAPHF